MNGKLLTLVVLACGLEWAARAEVSEQEVVITYDGELVEFARYQEGDRYVVEIPSSHRSRLIRGDTSACASKGGITVWTFPNPPGTQAVLQHTAGRVEITFSTGTPAMASAPTASPAPVPSLFAVEMPAEPRLPIVAEGPAASSAPRELTAATLADQSISLANFALDVPDSPAFAVLGVAPETVVRPSNPQELITSILNGVDRNGHFQTGLALDTAPYLLFFGKDVSLGRYQESYLTRLLTRTQVSFATSKGTQSEDLATRLALGFHFTLLDRGDPRFDLDLQNTYDAIDEQIRQARGPIPPGAGMQEQAARDEAQMRPLFKAAFAEARRRNWNRSNWALGAAPSWISLGGDSEDFRWNGATAWTSLAYGFEGIPALENSSQLILHARYRNHEEVPDLQKEGAFKRQDSFAVGARLRIGTVDTNCSFDGAYLREWSERAETSAYRVSLGLERRMTNNLWLSLSFGKEFGREDQRDPLLILGTFKLGYAEKPAPIAPVSTAAVPVVLRESSARPAPVDEPLLDVPPATRSKRSPGTAATRVVFLPQDAGGAAATEKVKRPKASGSPREATLPADPVTEKIKRPTTPAGAREATLPGGTATEKVKRPSAPGGAREATLPGGTATEKTPRPVTPAGAREATLPGEAPDPSSTKKTKRPLFPTGARDATLPPE